MSTKTAPKPASKKSESRAFRLSPESWARLDAACVQFNCTQTEALRFAIDQTYAQVSIPNLRATTPPQNAK
jgi:hypothetical protein